MGISKMSEGEILRILENIEYPKLEYRSVKKDYDVSKNVNSEVCSKCGGYCCKRCGCHFSPDDFEDVSFEGLKKEIEKGYISIDYVDGEEIYQRIGVYILRIRNEGAPIVDLGGGRTKCILLTEKGCKLDYEHRPSGGKLLIPSSVLSNGKINLLCKSRYDIRDCCYEWLPHKKVLKKLVEYFQNKDIPCSL